MRKPFHRPIYATYITTNPERDVLYVGVTNNIGRRMVEHYSNRGYPDTFAGNFYCYNLVYYEESQYILNAYARERQIKGWSRAKKDALINSVNPTWAFLNKEVCTEWPPRKIWGPYYERLRANKKKKWPMHRWRSWIRWRSKKKLARKRRLGG